MTRHENTHTPDPRHTFLKIPDLMAGWAKGSTYVYELVKQPDFPKPVVAGTWRLDHVMAYEEDVASGQITRMSTPNCDDQDDLDVLAPRRLRKKAS